MVVGQQPTTVLHSWLQLKSARDDELPLNRNQNDARFCGSEYAPSNTLPLSLPLSLPISLSLSLFLSLSSSLSLSLFLFLSLSSSLSLPLSFSLLLGAFRKRLAAAGN